MKTQYKVKLNRTETSTIRWICGFILKERKKNADLRDLLGMEPVSLVIKKGRQRWLGHVESSSSRMCVIYHNWSATKQRPHPQSVAEISRHSVLSGDRIQQCETSSGSRHKDTDQSL